VEHPYTFVAKDGTQRTTVGVFLPDFGSPEGALLTCRFDPDEVVEAADGTNCFRSFLSPGGYEPYDRGVFIDTLNDWGWFGQGPPPPWFAGGIGRHGGAA
jgi:hypothetical protein